MDPEFLKLVEDNSSPELINRIYDLWTKPDGKFYIYKIQVEKGKPIEEAFANYPFMIENVRIKLAFVRWANELLKFTGEPREYSRHDLGKLWKHIEPQFQVLAKYYPEIEKLDFNTKTPLWKKSTSVLNIIRRDWSFYPFFDEDDLEED